MSNFCRSANVDDDADAVALSGAAEATAFIWGGASGAEYGQILDIWSLKDKVRIKAEERTPPANWIVSYKIPAKYVGMTFVGVKAGTALRETENSIRVGLETAADAKKRCNRFPSLPVPKSTSGCPAKLTPELWERLLNHTKTFEGITDFMYNDKGKPQRVTCGVGKLIADETAALGLRKFFVHPEGREPSDDEMKADYAAASSDRKSVV